MGCSHTPALDVNTQHLKRGFPPMLCSVIAHSCVSQPNVAGISGDSSQKEQNPAPWGPAPTRSSSQQQHLDSVALVTWAFWQGHFAGDSLVLPFIFQSNSQNQIPKMNMYLQWAQSHHPGPLCHKKSRQWMMHQGNVESEGLDGIAGAFFFCPYELQVRIHPLGESS